MDGKLAKTIDKIELLCKQNPEFDTELRKRLGISMSPSYINREEKRIGMIAKYLGLDYFVDTKESTIDYSFVENANVRNQLVSDNREMMRYRYGTRSHTIDFNEFCRYAHFQAEMLLNYYYDTVENSDIDSIKARIKKYNEDAKGYDQADDVGAISYNVKLFAFSREFNSMFAFNVNTGMSDYQLFNDVRKVRNELSHRSVSTDKLEISECQKRLRQYRLPLKVDGRIDWHRINSERELLVKYNNEIKNHNWFKQYKYLLWYHTMPFEEIANGISRLSNIVRVALTNN